MSKVLQLFSHSDPFAAGPLAEQLKNTMGGAQAAEKRQEKSEITLLYLILVTAFTPLLS